MFYQVVVTRSDSDERFDWVGNDIRILRRLRDVAFLEGWWLLQFRREGRFAILTYRDDHGESLEQRVQFLEVQKASRGVSLRSPRRAGVTSLRPHS